LTHVQHNLARESAEQPEDTEAVFGHAQRHSPVVAALQFHVDQAAVDSLAEEIQS
jgi:hypothetical protein